MEINELTEQMKCWHYNDTLLVVPCSKSTGKPTAFVRLILNQCLVEPLETCPLGLKSKDKEKESLFYFACSENYCTMSLLREKSSHNPSFEQLGPRILRGFLQFKANLVGINLNFLLSELYLNFRFTSIVAQFSYTRL